MRVDYTSSAGIKMLKVRGVDDKEVKEVLSLTDERYNKIFKGAEKFTVNEAALIKDTWGLKVEYIKWTGDEFT